MSRGLIYLVYHNVIEACREKNLCGPVCWIGEWGHKLHKDVWE